jgi:hypothetical protein
MIEQGQPCCTSNLQVQEAESFLVERLLVHSFGSELDKGRRTEKICKQYQVSELLWLIVQGVDNSRCGVDFNERGNHKRVKGSDDGTRITNLQ